MRRFIHAVATSPLINLIVGLLLLVSGLSEAAETVVGDLENWRLRTSHTISLLALLHVFNALSTLQKALPAED